MILNRKVKEDEIADEDIGNLASLTIAVKHLEERMDIFGDTIKTCNIDHSPAAVAERLDRAWDLLDLLERTNATLLEAMTAMQQSQDILLKRMEQIESRYKPHDARVKNLLKITEQDTTLAEEKKHGA